MNAIVNVDKAGRIVLPKPVRDELHLAAGDPLELDVSENRIVLRPARAKTRMYKKRGIWVLHTGSAMECDLPKLTLERILEERENKFLGKGQ